MLPPSSPPLKYQRVEEGEAFVPSLLPVPLRPPVLGFPDEKSIVAPEDPLARGGADSRGTLYGKEMLFNSSPTLEFSAEDMEAFLTQIRQHPKCEEVREQLGAVNESYLQEVFGEEDAKEDDTRRRVDYNAALSIMKDNSSKRLSMCISCLTRGQHRHYCSWVARYMRDGVLPKSMEEYPDLSTVIDLAQREQTAFFKKFKEEMVSCSACKVEAGYRKRAADDVTPAISHRTCWNHNFMDAHVEDYVKRWLHHKLQLLNGVLAEVSVAIPGGNRIFSEVVCDLRKSAKAVKESLPTVTPCARTAQLAARRVAETVRLRELRGLDTVLASAGTLPTLPLPVQLLDERSPVLHTAAGELVASLEAVKQSEDQQKELPEALPPVLPYKNAVGVTFTLRLCKSALLKLATAHLSSFRGSFSLPVSYKWTPSEGRLDISIEKPFPSESDSRRNINAMSMKRLVDAEARLPTNSRCSTPGLGESKCYSEVSFGTELSFLCTTNCSFDIRGKNPVLRMVKMEYNCKGYNAIPDDERTLLYESFSKKEVVCMWALLHCNPTAVLYVYRINAYSSAVVGIEHFSAVSFANQVLREWSNDLEVQAMWSCLYDMLLGVVASVVRQHQEQSKGSEGSHSGDERGTFVLKKTNQHFEVSLCSVQSCYPRELLIDAMLGSFIEPSAHSVCQREYLPPCVWPFPHRIPFTYGPAPLSRYVVNRTTAERYESQYYAENDVWEQRMHCYSVGADGIVSEKQLADE
uniref:Uncharacterized protein n=1 Tax=Trypanosoma congolense (strain IL3000) TaxID=1068625 RepID=G0UUX5_TRYCI|nr:conserved hypothetical protein [Trypanosoma congolense IL3000]